MTERRADWAPRLAPDVSWVLVDDEVVALDAAANQVHLVSATGALLFQLFDGSATVDDLAADVAEVFGVPFDQAQADVERFALEMAQRGLVSPPPGSDP